MKTTFGKLSIGTKFTARGNKSYTKTEFKYAQWEKSSDKRSDRFMPDDVVEAEVSFVSFRPATMKQVAYITSLMSRYGKSFTAPQNFTIEQASKMIDTILHEPTSMNLFDTSTSGNETEIY